MASHLKARASSLLLGSRPLSRFVQINRLVMLTTGAGSESSPPFWLPRARYTAFVDYDPEGAVRSFRILDARNRGFPDWSSIPAEVGQVSAPEGF
ncbi:MAG: hypothetical protein JF887_12215 [Candidatus Dormibacteraeota bacterium]|uniref:Uncharacterized protein n=1 Tax=Candidatus Amunia macphersoniae TaxID=3127014 RepID=A0A934NFN5_9BACT|nr:hypothetical protein [Candidatus Dormibacteraeota bacterium]